MCQCSVASQAKRKQEGAAEGAPAAKKTTTELPPLPDPVKITRIEIAPCKGKWQVGTVNGGESIDAAEAVETANRPAVLPNGTEVNLHDLVGTDAVHNGRFGKVLSWGVQTGQYNVRLQGGVQSRIPRCR